MKPEEHYKKLERMYLSAPINAFYKPRIKVGKGRAEIRQPVGRNFFHAADAAHGSVLFKVLDDAAFFAANSLVNEFFVLTGNFNIHFTRPVSSGMLKAEGKVKVPGKKVITAESSVCNEQGKELAFGTGVFVISKIALGKDLGYK